MANELDYSAMRFWWDIIQSVSVIGIAIYVWLKSRSQVNTNRIEEIEKEMVQLDKRLEKAVGHKDLEGIHIRLGGISRDLSKLEGEFKSNSELLSRIDNYIRNN
ncbi:hypothetical protein ACU6U9_02700 [Pseudomonas sp. HK3]